MNIIILPVYLTDPRTKSLGLDVSKDTVTTVDAIIPLHNVTAIHESYNSKRIVIHTTSGIFDSPMTLDEITELLMGKETNETEYKNEWNRLR